MPYVPPERRMGIDPLIEQLADQLHGSGDYNYALTRLLARSRRLSYQQINMVIGVLECVKLELYRRLAAPYEDQKKDQNGDIPEYERQSSERTVTHDAYPSSYLCAECAKALGGTWPHGHVATVHNGVCTFCGRTRALAHHDDWNWSDQTSYPGRD